MIKKTLILTLILTSTYCLASNSAMFGASASKNSFEEEEQNEIEWLDFETAIERNKDDRKFIFIDIYTSWCGWCKKMDASTFKDEEVVEYMSEHFYAVKMDAESNEGIVYNEVLYEKEGRYNKLAFNLLAGKMTFPSFVVLSKREVKLGAIVGFQKPNQLISALSKYTKKK